MASTTTKTKTKNESGAPVWVITASTGGFSLQNLSTANGVRTFPSLDTAIKCGADEAEEASGTLLVYGFGGRLSDKLNFATTEHEAVTKSDHVSCEVTRSDSGWAVRPNGPSDQQVRYFGTKGEAMTFATAAAEERQCPLVVYYSDGDLQRVVAN